MTSHIPTSPAPSRFYRRVVVKNIEPSPGADERRERIQHLVDELRNHDVPGVDPLIEMMEQYLSESRVTQLHRGRGRLR